MNINEVTLAGRLTRDPESNQARSGITVTKIRLAVNDRKKAASGDWEKHATFMDVTFFDRVADTIAQYFHKGDPIWLRARLEVSEWEDKDTGKKRSALQVVGNTFQFMPKGQSDAPTDRGATARDLPASHPQAKPESQDTSEEHDEIPF